jgi:hypothetical protein
MMSETLLRWLADRLFEAVSQAVVRWTLDTCNTEPPILRTGHRKTIGTTVRFASGIVDAARARSRYCGSWRAFPSASAASA